MLLKLLITDIKIKTCKNPKSFFFFSKKSLAKEEVQSEQDRNGVYRYISVTGRHFADLSVKSPEKCGGVVLIGLCCVLWR